MKKKILTLCLLTFLCVCTTLILTSCDEDGSDDFEYVDGKWVLTRAETVRVTADYHSASEEVDIYSSSDVYTHKMDYKYHPVDNDPSDGPTPHEGVFSCTIDIPDTLTPGENFNVLLEAKVISDEMPGHTTGICCSFGVLYDSFEGIRMVDMMRSSGRYAYNSGTHTVYPVYAGGNFIYGEDPALYDPYKSSMSDTLTTEAPKVYKEALELNEPKLLFSFSSNAGESVFEYSFVQVEVPTP
jgi:hypothetical protein